MGVEVAALEVCKPELSGCSCVAIGSAQCNLHTEMVDTGPSFGAAMIRSPVHENNDLLAPLGTKLSCEDLRQS